MENCSYKNFWLEGGNNSTNDLPKENSNLIKKDINYYLIEFGKIILIYFIFITYLYNSFYILELISIYILDINAEIFIIKGWCKDAINPMSNMYIFVVYIISNVLTIIWIVIYKYLITLTIKQYYQKSTIYGLYYSPIYISMGCMFGCMLKYYFIQETMDVPGSFQQCFTTWDPLISINLYKKILLAKYCSKNFIISFIVHCVALCISNIVNKKRYNDYLQTKGNI